MQDIYLMQPINKTAALVTNQSGCESDPSLEDQRDCIIRSLRAIEQQILSLPKKHDWRKDLGVKKLGLQNQLSYVNKQIKKENVFSRDLKEYIITVCKEHFSRDRWFSILKKAQEMRDQDLNNFSK